MGEGSDGGEKIVCFNVWCIGKREKIGIDGCILRRGENFCALKVGAFLIKMTLGGVGGIGHFGDELRGKSGPSDEISLSDGSDEARFCGAEATSMEILCQFCFRSVFMDNDV